MPRINDTGPQRRADYMSTKNVGGNKPVDPESGPAGVSLGFAVKPEHAYLGHFKQEKFLREGHNQVPAVSTPFPAPGAGPRRRRQDVIETLSRRQVRTAVRQGGGVAAAVAAQRPVIAARVLARQQGLGRAGVRAAVREARANPESRRSERQARRGARRSNRQAFRREED